MNTNTGELYQLRGLADAEPGEELPRSLFMSHLEHLADAGERLEGDEVRAAAALSRGDRIVAVGEGAAQRAALGDRELRRRRRRKAKGVVGH